MEKKYLKLADCNLEALRPEHQDKCFVFGGYVGPDEEYTDLDGIIHSPGYHNPRDNPKNRTGTGLYKLDFLERQKEDADEYSELRMQQEFV